MNSPTNSQFTILRIKRKRNEEPLDALVVDASASSRKKKVRLRGGLDVFQFAQTVEPGAWENERDRLELQEQISKLVTAPEASPSPRTQEGLASPRRGSTDDAAGRRYRIMQHHSRPESDSEDSDTRRRKIPATSPPKVIPAASIPTPASATAANFRIFDAVRDENKQKEKEDEEMANFLPMLQEYLSMNDIVPSIPTASSLAASTSATSTSDDYVYDVFYHRPTTLSDWNNSTNVATLTGLPPSITNPYDSDSDSEVDDEADEDSNAEEYYKNDYPDESESDDTGSEKSHDSDEFSNYEEEHQNEWLTLSM